MRSHTRNTLLAAGTIAALASIAAADDWTMTITVDNQYDVYFGTNLVTNFFAGGDGTWSTVETYNAFGRAPTDYLYVSTASDYSVAQGFMGVFQNITQGTTIKTGDAAWEVFPAGAHLTSINSSWPAVWPSNNQPSQSEVDQAIAYAETNGLWQPTSFDPSWTNASHGGPWPTNLTGLPGDVNWIWHDSGATSAWPYDDPYGGANHDEFLVFRIAGDAVPSPGAAALCPIAAMTLLRRRRRH
ncbi:MAG: hypothetical protein AAFX05_00860 [Planctomycetota bacterium]